MKRIIQLAFIIFSLASFSFSLSLAGNGDVVNGFPNYYERSMLAVVNTVRQGLYADY